MSTTRTASAAKATPPRKVSRTKSGKLWRVWGGGTKGRNTHELTRGRFRSCGKWAAAAGTTTATVSRILAGRRKPSLEMLNKLALACGAPVSWVMSRLGMKDLPAPLARSYKPPMPRVSASAE